MIEILIKSERYVSVLILDKKINTFLIVTKHISRKCKIISKNTEAKENIQ